MSEIAAIEVNAGNVHPSGSRRRVGDPSAAAKILDRAEEVVTAEFRANRETEGL